MKHSPRHLGEAGRKVWKDVLAEWDLDGDDLLVLQRAAEAADRAEQARVILDEDGLVVEDRYGTPKEHPMVSVEYRSRTQVARLVKQIQDSRAAYEAMQIRTERHEREVDRRDRPAGRARRVGA